MADFGVPPTRFELVFRVRVPSMGMRGLEKSKPAWEGGWCAPNEVRTRVSALRGPRPRPLDNGGGERRNFTITLGLRQLYVI